MTPPFPALLDAARAGDELAFASLWRSVNPRLLRALRAQDADAAEDLAAEVWTEVASLLPGFIGDEVGFRVWVWQLARTALRQYRVQEARHPTRVLPTESFDRRSIADDPLDRVVDALSAQDAIDRLVADLSPDQAEIVLLRVLGGFDTAEVALIVGRGQGYVRILQQRAMLKLSRTFRRVDDPVAAR